MRTFRNRPADLGRERAQQLARRYGSELRLARISTGLSQRQLAHRSRVSQQIVSQAERGDPGISLLARCRMAAAVGHELGFQLYPVEGVALRDSGQLGMAEAILSTLHSSWSARLEALVAVGDRRAADILLTRPDETVEVEIERTIVDLQAQLRAGQLKRQALAERSSVPVRLIIAVPDSARSRAKLLPFQALLAHALPVPSREVSAALRTGRPIGGDGLLFVRAGRLTASGGTR